ncbi:MAG: IS1 family transposase [Deltaproteobacteria bacterium]|nr:IS1 family transposase [Deltaproteobacteria bacterium]MBW2306587.1 IS1 family transposase [Deltaproteobacteria bacterium]
MKDDLSQFFCPNEDCRHYGLRNQGNIRKRAIYGKDARRLLICSTCKKRFAETRCTVFFGTKYSRETIRQILLHVAEGVGVRATARLLGLSKDGVNRIILVAGEHCARVLQNLLTDLNLTELQLDELWVFIKKNKARRRWRLNKGRGKVGYGPRSMFPPA